MKSICPLFFLLGASLVQSLPALDVSSLFGDHMVLQRQVPIPVFGTGDPGQAVTVILANGVDDRRGETFVNARGEFIAYLAPLEAGTDYSLIVQTPGASEEFNDILIGDVWVCSGQSNMAFELDGSFGAEDEVAHSENSQIRLFTVMQLNSDEPVADVAGGDWKRCDPSSAPGFSAVGYYFGKFLEAELEVPIGLVQSAWGGTQVESWTSQESLLGLDDPDRFYLRNLDPTLDAEDPSTTEKRINALLEEFNASRPADRRISARRRSSSVPIRASNLFNGMIHPLLDFPIKGAIWYQGESNSARAHEYRTLFPLMIEDWRRQWGIGDFPFYFVQLANYLEATDEPVESEWAELREAQAGALALPHTGMAVIIDIGEGDDIHPRNKRDVGYRLALQALQKTYGHAGVTASGPVLRKVVPEGESLRLFFEPGHGKLDLRSQPEPTFAVASKEGEFHWADAVVEHGTIRVSSPEVPHPAYVRYAWASNPPANLFNDAGLPASPFRTDDRPAITEGKRYQPDVFSSANDVAFGENVADRFLRELEWHSAGDLRVAVTGDDGNTPEGLFDDSLLTRWSSFGLGESVLLDLEKSATVRGLKMAFFAGDRRRTIFKVETSSDLESWKERFFGWSSGASTALEDFPIEASSARYVLLTFYGNTSNLWNSVTELKVER